jgi:chromosome segregation ATPase
VEPAAIAFISALTSIMVAIGGAYVARRKGLPAINAEIESRNGELIKLLEGQLAALRVDIKDSQDDFTQCKAKLTRALDENHELSRRLSLAESDLVTLYRERGRRPPSRTQPPRENR